MIKKEIPPWAVPLLPPPPKAYSAALPDIHSPARPAPDHHHKSQALLQTLQYRFDLVVPPELAALRLEALEFVHEHISLWYKLTCQRKQQLGLLDVSPQHRCASPTPESPKRTPSLHSSKSTPSLKQAESSTAKAPDTPTFTILSFGSYYLGVPFVDSDLDLLLIVPSFIDRKSDFFGELKRLFQTKLHPRNVLAIPDAYVPSLELRYRSLKVDLLLATLDIAYLLLAQGRLSPSAARPLLDKLDIKSPP